jgi:hypothetical protein
VNPLGRALTSNCCCHGRTDRYASLALGRAVQQNSGTLDSTRSGSQPLPNSPRPISEETQSS